MKLIRILLGCVIAQAAPASLAQNGDAFPAQPVRLLVSVPPGGAVRRAGRWHRGGDRRRPRIAVLATGDEVRPAGEPLGGAGIPDANGPGLAALVAAAGAEPLPLGIASDDLVDVLSRQEPGLAAGADAIVV